MHVTHTPSHTRRPCGGDGSERMGLDITAYRQLSKVESPEVDEGGEPVNWRTEHKIRSGDIDGTEESWPGRTAGLSPGIYTYADSFWLRAGSYSGYNAWRDELAQRAGYVSARHVWATTPAGPFVELIDFTDCDGIIGPVVSAKLAKDFAEHEAAIEAASNDPDSWFMDKYREWRRAFEMAADGGAVDFH